MLKRAKVLMVFYDLPTKEPIERKVTVCFRKELFKLGFTMVQESVYVKLIHNGAIIKNTVDHIRKIAPKAGSVCALSLSLGEFKNMRSIVGKEFDMSLFADEIVEV